ncbi:MAG TPA: COX15/CtaA family protein [Gemmataceae bacterium]|nr:COX15/CtaA family protein [Gemmataceae bacterium]
MPTQAHNTTGSRLYRRLLLAVAVLTAAMTAVQLALGAVVTSFQVGMADPVWPTAPWYLLHARWGDHDLGFLIEHTHRLTGHLVGLCVIGLAVLLWLGAPRWWQRLLGWAASVVMVVPLGVAFAFKRGAPAQWEPWFYGCLLACLVAVIGLFVLAWRRRDRGVWLGWLGTLALTGVILQGILGGFRVYLNSLAGTDLAAVHGTFAQVFFALVVGIAVAVPSPRPWPPASPALRRWSLAAVAVVFVQLVLGAAVRHTHAPHWGHAHLLVALAVVAAVVGLVRLAYRDEDRRTARSALLLGVLVVVQVLLGLEAWVMRFGSGVYPEMVQVTLPRALVWTAHVLVGAGILATAVATALRVQQRAAGAEQPAAAPAGCLEGVA